MGQCPNAHLHQRGAGVTTKSEILKTIRRHCIECSGGSRWEADNCVIPRCPLYPYRKGKDPAPTPRRLNDRSASQSTVSASEGVEQYHPTGQPASVPETAPQSTVSDRQTACQPPGLKNETPAFHRTVAKQTDGAGASEDPSKPASDKETLQCGK
jgi:hypothetical protein